jgi:hypothetical protein
MKPYHKIQTVLKRDPPGGPVTDEYARPEFEYLANLPWIWTEKIDGTNIRVMWLEKEEHTLEITFGGRTDNANMQPNLFERLTEMFTKRYDLFPTMFKEPVCLYGEGFGAGTYKGGGRYSATPNFALFDVKIGDWWLERANVADIAQKLDLVVAPFLGAGTLPQMIDYVRGGFNSVWGDFPAEGIVAQPAVPLVNRHGKRIITKLKCKDFRV